MLRGNEQGLLSCACRGGVVGMVRGGGGCRAREMSVVAGSAWGCRDSWSRAVRRR
jgi:hypothetical protein